MSIVFVWETLLPSEQIRVDGADGFNVTPTPPHPQDSESGCNEEIGRKKQTYRSCEHATDTLRGTDCSELDEKHIVA